MSAIKIKNLSKSFEDFSLNIKELDIKEGYVTGFIGCLLYTSRCV